MKIDFINRNAFAGMATLTPMAETAPTGGIEMAMANPRTVSTMLPPNTSNAHVILIKSFQIATVFGVPDIAIKCEENFSGTVSTNPDAYC